jgi:cellulose synthase/poly-beta-1,6-N-acetylglucosamine synthase-like glycosyltransferase
VAVGQILFWAGFAGVFYAYVGYPLVLVAMGRIAPRPLRRDPPALPAVSVVLPVHNEEAQLPGRLDNLQATDYPSDRLEVIVVSDGSTDASVDIAHRRAAGDPRFRIVEVPERRGKGNALNEGVAHATGEIVVFTDAGIRLEPGAIRALVAPFADPEVGCVSGEDRIPGGGGEGLYGRYELFLRRTESSVGSIVGASGSIYAQRRELCPDFAEGMAPDFLSVLRTVEAGYRAVSEPGARGDMSALDDHAGEFRRKVRTLIRGMTVLGAHPQLLNPFRTGRFAFVLLSHKAMRWAVPLFLGMMLVGNLALLDNRFYAAVAVPHALFYLLGMLSLAGVPGIGRWLPARIAGYFVVVNSAVAVAWWQFLRGRRQEIWSPSRRDPQRGVAG